MNSSELIRKIKKAGFVFDRHAKGSHEIWFHPTYKKRTVIPHHPGKEIPQGILRAIIRQIGLSKKSFDQL